MIDPAENDFGRPPQDVIDAWAKNCRCCPDCEVARPGDGCCAGGVCDHGRCTCGEYEDGGPDVDGGDE